MTKVKVTYMEYSPIRQKIYYDVYKVKVCVDGTIGLEYFDHVRECMRGVVIENYFEIEIF